MRWSTASRSGEIRGDIPMSIISNSFSFFQNENTCCNPFFLINQSYLAHWIHAPGFRWVKSVLDVPERVPLKCVLIITQLLTGPFRTRAAGQRLKKVL